jgi:hypothetical protein
VKEEGVETLYRLQQLPGEQDFFESLGRKAIGAANAGSSHGFPDLRITIATMSEMDL